jgi:CheY-like chemotaxis protein
MSNEKRSHVLCVDDEARVVEGLKLNLRRDYEVHTALGGEEGLQKLKELGGVAVVISDMRMPGMDGATFLKRVMHTYPDSTRILLTGEAARDRGAGCQRRADLSFPDQALSARSAEGCSGCGGDSAQTGECRAHAAAGDRDRMHSSVGRRAGHRQSGRFGRASRIKRLAMQFAESLGCTGF